MTMMKSYHYYVIVILIFSFAIIHLINIQLIISQRSSLAR